MANKSNGLKKTIVIGNISDEYFNKTQLKKGIDIEMEHTNNKKTAELIAKEHLLENPNYYKEVKNTSGKTKLVSVNNKSMSKKRRNIKKGG